MFYEIQKRSSESSIQVIDQLNEPIELSTLATTMQPNSSLISSDAPLNSVSQEGTLSKPKRKDSGDSNVSTRPKQHKSVDDESDKLEFSDTSFVSQSSSEEEETLNLNAQTPHEIIASKLQNQLGENAESDGQIMMINKCSMITIKKCSVHLEPLENILVSMKPIEPSQSNNSQSTSFLPIPANSFTHLIP
jgi:hypothetical protein